MASFIQNPIAYGVRSEPGDTQGGPIGQELIAGPNISITPIDVGGGDIRIRISSTGGAATTYVGASDPTPQNDAVDTAGIGRSFSVGEYWLNMTKGTLFVCVDNTVNAAVWSKLEVAGAKATLNFGDASPKTIKSGVKGRVTHLIVDVQQAFNGTAPTLQIGDAGDTDRLMLTTELDLKTVAKYFIDCYYEYTVATDIIATYVADGSTQGSAVIELQYIN